jgi:hypothetical protein
MKSSVHDEPGWRVGKSSKLQKSLRIALADPAGTFKSSVSRGAAQDLGVVPIGHDVSEVVEYRGS